MKLFGDRIGKYSMKNGFFPIFVCKDVDWEKVVQLAEQQEAIKGKRNNSWAKKVAEDQFKHSYFIT